MNWNAIIEPTLATLLVGVIVGIFGMWTKLGQIQSWQKSHDKIEDERAARQCRDIQALNKRLDDHALLAQALNNLAEAVRHLKGV